MVHYEARIIQIMMGVHKKDLPCPYDDVMCEECKMFEKTGCYLQYPEGGGIAPLKFVEHGWSKHNYANKGGTK